MRKRNLVMILLGASFGIKLGLSVFTYYYHDKIYEKYIKPTVYELKEELTSEPYLFKERENKIYLVSP